MYNTNVLNYAYQHLPFEVFDKAALVMCVVRDFWIIAHGTHGMESSTPNFQPGKPFPPLTGTCWFLDKLSDHN